MSAAERGHIDDVIMPRTTRARIARALAMLRGKRVEMHARASRGRGHWRCWRGKRVELPGRKHDNLPV